MEKFEKLYKANIEEVSKAVANSMIMCGSSNWDFYFQKKPKNSDFELLENISLVEFENRSEFDSFLKNNRVVDFSLEHDKPCVLIHG